MDFAWYDFNLAEGYFSGSGQRDWNSLCEVFADVPLCLQASDQAGRIGAPIFDPKATNRMLTDLATDRGWGAVPVPESLGMFGNEWDAGRGTTLAEWQFSNYPFLWNNLIRSEAVYRADAPPGQLTGVGGLVQVTRSGRFPASNSTLYFEQAAAQIEAVLPFGLLSIPVRLVGLTIEEADEVDAVWTEYGSRYSRAPVRQYGCRAKVLYRRNGGISFEVV